jgi:hypothetical protein
LKTRALAVIRDSWLMFGIGVLFLLVLELVLGVAFSVRDRVIASRGTIDFRMDADAYPDSAWVREYYTEFHRSSDVEWRPYVYWRRRPFTGQYVNIDSAGIRRTVAYQPATGGSPPKRVFVFGGSTVWGTGARDSFTIPSLIARELQASSVTAEVVNFGESGYVSSQEVIALMLQLQKGDIPDLVVFYDGVNDTYAAYQQGRPGRPHNEFNRIREFNLTQPERSGERTRLALQDMARSLSTVRLLSALLHLDPGASAISALPHDSIAVDSLARGVVDVYRANIELVRAMGRQYGFRCLFYWQPTIFEKTHLTAYETARRAEMAGLESFYRRTYASLRASGVGRTDDEVVRDVSLVFADVDQPIYIDWVHPGETGNVAVSKRIAADAAPFLRGTARAKAR